jgi:transposase-like protein
MCKKNSKMDTVKHDVDASPLSLDEIACLGAQQIIRMAVEAELNMYLEQFQHMKDAQGRPAVVRNGYNKARDITIGSGQITVRVPRTRTRTDDVPNYASNLVPKYMRRSPTVDELIPLLYLKGISTGNMYSALKQLLGDQVSGLSASTVSRLKNNWTHEYENWRQRDLSTTRYCYLWADGVYTNVRFSDNRLCLLVVVGATEDGEKELVAVESGYRESKESWATVFRDLVKRGMQGPNLVIGDGALGLWKAIQQIYPDADWQRCWVHKTRNVLDKMPKAIHPRAKRMLKEIYMAETKDQAEVAFANFIDTFGAKYYKATECLEKDRKYLLTFYNYPAKHWRHIRTTNPIESTFATVRLRTKATRGQGTEETTFMMVFKLLEHASQRWQKMCGYKLIPKVLNNVEFVDGEELNKAA